MDKLAIGIDIGGTNIKAGLVDSSGLVTQFSKIPTNAQYGFKKTFASIKNLIGNYINFIGAENIIGIGCACTGQIDPVSGKVLYAASSMPELLGFEVKKELKAIASIDVEVENDVNAGALGEKWIGAARDIDDFINITLGTGVGGAIYRNGGLERGFRGVAAEFGHVIIKMDGEPCTCGNRGCLERYASVSALIKHFKKEVLQGERSIVLDLVNGNMDNISGETIYKAKALGDVIATKVVDEYNNYIVTGALALIHTLNPQAVIIGGGITELGDEFIKPIRDMILERVLPVFGEKLIIRRAELGDNAGLCGACRKFFI